MAGSLASKTLGLLAAFGMIALGITALIVNLGSISKEPEIKTLKNEAVAAPSIANSDKSTTDIHCFDRIIGGEDGITTVYTEMDDSLCDDENYTDVTYGALAHYDISRAGAEYSADTGKAYRTEYHLLNGTTLTFK